MRVSYRWEVGKLPGLLASLPVLCRGPAARLGRVEEFLLRHVSLLLDESLPFEFIVELLAHSNRSVLDDFLEHGDALRRCALSVGGNTIIWLVRCLLPHIELRH